MGFGINGESPKSFENFFSKYAPQKHNSESQAVFSKYFHNDSSKEVSLSSRWVELKQIQQDEAEKARQKSLKQECRVTDCRDVYYHEATQTHYRKVNGELQKIEPRIEGADIIFNANGSRYEYITENGYRVRITISKDNKIKRKEYYNYDKNSIGWGDVVKIEEFDANEKLIKTTETEK